MEKGEMTMPVMEISIIPLGTKTTSISQYIADSVSVLKEEKGIDYEITAMGTIIEFPSLDLLFELAKKIHQVALKKGVGRVFTTIKIDDRIDKRVTIKGKIKSVKDKL